MEASDQSRSLAETTERLRRAQKAGRIGTWDWNVKTNELIWDGVEAVHGLPEGSFGGTFDGYLQDMHPDDRPRVLRAIHGAAEAGTDLDVEYRIVLPDGSERWVAGRGTCFRDESGNVVRMSGTCQDVTERKRADEDKEALLSFAAHELRSPLSTVMGFSRLIESSVARSPESFDEMTREGISAIVEESMRMADVITYFLDLAHAEARPSEIDVAEVDLTDLLQKEIERVRLDASDMELEAELPDGPLLVQSESRRLEQIISNLLGNAAKYGGTPPRALVSCELKDGEVTICVRDYGPGIPEEERTRVFERFYRGTNAPGKGLGIGLYLSRQFAEQLGGRLELDEDIPAGTKFRLTLPA